MPIYKSTLNTNKPNKEKKSKDEKPKNKMPKEKKKKIICLSFALFCLVCFCFLCFNNPIRKFLLGVLGIFAYPTFLSGIILSIAGASGKKYIVNKRYVVCLSLSLFFLMTIVHLILTRNVSVVSYGKYLSQTYQTQVTGAGVILSLITYPIVKYLTVVGAYIFVIIGLVVSVGFTIDSIVVARNTPQKEQKSNFEFNNFKELNGVENDVPITFEHKQEDLKKKIARQKLGLEKNESTIISSSMHIDDISSKLSTSKPMTKQEYILTPPEIVIPEYAPKKTEPKPKVDDVIVHNVDDFYSDAKVIEGKSLNNINLNTTQEDKSNINYNFAENNNQNNLNSYSNNWGNNSNNSLNNADNNYSKGFANNNGSGFNNVNAEVKTNFDVEANKEDFSANKFEKSNFELNYNETFKNNFSSKDIENSEIKNNVVGKPLNSMSNINTSNLDVNLQDDIDEDDELDEYLEEVETGENRESGYNSISKREQSFASKPIETKSIETKPINEINEYGKAKDTTTIPFARSVNSETLRSSSFSTESNVMTKPLVEEKQENKLGRPKKHHPPYVRPPVDLLKYIDNVEVVTDEECNENIEKLEKVLEDFKIPAKVKAVQVGPAVTRYEIGMPTGVSVKKVQMHADDIAMALASNGGIRIEAPIPGKNAVGIEVPNSNVSSVSMREMVESLEFQKRTNPMSFVLGKDINGQIQFCNLDKMPHLLVAGSTGSGKSVCLNTMLISMLYKSSPEDVRLILIDPKTVEFSIYANLPHLLTPHIITTKEQAINALNWAIKEMEYRYSLLQQNEVVNIKDYNNLPIVKDGEVDKLPYIVILIDELNDLMIDTKREMEERIMKLAQKSRAAGIHLVIATQRPSVDVITGTIKANLPSRIAFALTNFADSKTVLDMGGAEKLLGRGDMLFKPNDAPEPRRVQGAYISSQEVSAVVKFIKANNPSDFDDSATQEITAMPEVEQSSNHGGNQGGGNFDPVMKDALRWFISANQASITMIQRRFGVGYARAARIVDQMEQNGFISAQDGSKPRQVLISMEEFNQIFPE